MIRQARKKVPRAGGRGVSATLSLSICGQVEYDATMGITVLPVAAAIGGLTAAKATFSAARLADAG